MKSLYATELGGYLRPFSDEAVAVKMKAYMRDQFEFLGIRKPELKTLLKAWMQERGLPTADELVSVIHELWDLPEREYQYVALEILQRQARQFRLEDIELLEYLVVNKSWWDTVDEVAGGLIGRYFLKYPEQIAPYTERWIQSENLWLKRSALIFQLKYRDQTNWELLTTYILQCAEHRDFFIRKAIGWALRQYARTNPDAVVQFVRDHEDLLSPLSVREALKHAATQVE